MDDDIIIHSLTHSHLLIDSLSPTHTHTATLYPPTHIYTHAHSYTHSHTYTHTHTHLLTHTH